MTPGQPGMAVSRRIEDEARRAALIALGEQLLAGEGDRDPGAGFIFRTAAQGRFAGRTCRRMRAIWRKSGADIEDKRKAARPPATLYQRSRARSNAPLRDIDARRCGAGADRRCGRGGSGARLLPQSHAGLGSPYRESAPRDLFDDYGLEDEIAALSSAARRLCRRAAGSPSRHTEALTAVDVNSGSFIQSGGLEETSLAVNLEAAAGDRPPDTPARHRRPDRGGFHPSRARARMRRACWRRWSKAWLRSRAACRFRP